MRRWRSRVRVAVSESYPRSEKMESFIHSEIKKREWPYKVIAGESETDRVILRTENYILLPDIDNKDTSHLLVLFTDPALLSIRELRGSHVPMLKQLLEMLKSRYPTDSIMFFHYPPSVWQLHLHVVTLTTNPRISNEMQKIHFLQDVISNLEIDSNYYTKATLSFILPFHHDLVNSVFT